MYRIVVVVVTQFGGSSMVRYVIYQVCTMTHTSNNEEVKTHPFVRTRLVQNHFVSVLERKWEVGLARKSAKEIAFI